MKALAIFLSFFILDVLSAAGTLIVTYQTGAKGERLKRVHFWLINEKDEQQLYPKENACADDSKALTRTVVIDQLSPGTYYLKFLIPNRDGLFEEYQKKEVTIKDGETSKIDHQFKPQYGTIKASVEEIPGIGYPNIMLLTESGALIQQNSSGQIEVTNLVPGAYILSFEEVEGYVSPENASIQLEPKAFYESPTLTYKKSTN